ncbi:MAG TPA: tetratricopeptide repeat protein [Desulfonatronum sp.]|nr:tetratricopeptide repeat protein [Desulfonatronum sp.]
MNAKIAWFEELLALEPNSKLFLSLARAYLQDERIIDAAQVLRKGLSFHPEHLEARLLLIRCLTELHDDDEAKKVTQSLANTLAGHPVFWNLWAEISRKSSRQDIALTLRLLVKLFHGESINWGHILEQGLKAVVLAEPKGFNDAPRDETPEAPAGAPEEMPQDETPEKNTKIALEKQAMDTTENDAREQFAASDSPADADKMAVDRNVEHPVVIQSRIPLPKPEEIPGYERTRVSVSPGMDKQSAKPESRADTSASTEPVLSETERRYYETRTYAALLADQGEIQEALELYGKLLVASKDEEQRLDLEDRIQELKEKIQKSQTPPGFLQGAKNSPTKDKASKETMKSPELIQTLTRLAQRLEARGGS